MNADEEHRCGRTKAFLGIGGFDFPSFAISGCHFQTVTICNGFVSLIHQALFHDAPVGLWIGAVGQNGYDINYGEKPFLLFRIPGAADLFFLEE